MDPAIASTSRLSLLYNAHSIEWGRVVFSLLSTPLQGLSIDGDVRRQMSCSYPLINLRSEHKKKYPSMKKNFLSSKKKYPSMKKNFLSLKKNISLQKKYPPRFATTKKIVSHPLRDYKISGLPPENPPKTPDFPGNPRKPPKTPKIVENGGFPGGSRGGPKPPKTPKIRVFGGSPRGARKCPPRAQTPEKVSLFDKSTFWTSISSSNSNFILSRLGELLNTLRKTHFLPPPGPPQNPHF